MIDIQYLAQEVSNLIEDYNKTYTRSNLFKQNPIFRNNLIGTIKQLIINKKVAKEHELEIHKRLLEAINRADIEIKNIIGINEEYVKNVLAEYGDEIGGYLLYCNKLIGQVCVNEYKNFNENVKK